jgi:hypothetical protein
MLVFLTQILISLYRYNSRLIAFYGSRRDALLLVEGAQDAKIKELAEVFFPANLDFGREPRHPLQEMIDFIRKRPSQPPSMDTDERKRRPQSKPNARQKNRGTAHDAASLKNTSQQAARTEPTNS